MRKRIPLKVVLELAMYVTFLWCFFRSIGVSRAIGGFSYDITSSVKIINFVGL